MEIHPLFRPSGRHKFEFISSLPDGHALELASMPRRVIEWLFGSGGRFCHVDGDRFFVRTELEYVFGYAHVQPAHYLAQNLKVLDVLLWYPR